MANFREKQGFVRKLWNVENYIIECAAVVFGLQALKTLLLTVSGVVRGTLFLHDLAQCSNVPRREV